jgi:hypothetical protein
MMQGMPATLDSISAMNDISFPFDFDSLLIGLLGACAPLVLEVWVTLTDVTHNHEPTRLAHPRASVALAVEGLASSGGDFLHGLADGLDVATWIRVTVE